MWGHRHGVLGFWGPGVLGQDLVSVSDGHSTVGCELTPFPSVCGVCVQRWW